MRPSLLTIAGTDPSSAAGVQVDLQVFRDLGWHGCSVITAVIAQNTQGASGWHVLSAEDVGAQLDAIFEDIPIAAVKIGVLPDAAHVHAMTRRLAARDLPTVVDPVLATGDGATSLVRDGALEAVRASGMMERVTVWTPNVPEAATLLGAKVEDVAAAPLMAARRLHQEWGPAAVLLKVGHILSDAGEVRDVFADASGARLLAGLPRLTSIGDVRGTGCQLSSAIATGLAAGQPPEQATERARLYLWDMLRRRARHVGTGRRVITRAGA